MRNKELIEKAVDALRDIENVGAIILFGSYAKGTETATSDIDFLVVLDVEKPKDVLPIVVKKLSAVDAEGRISPRLTNLKDYDKGFFLEVFRHGKVLFGKAVLSGEKMLAPYRIIYYDISKLPASKKVLVSKRIHGSESSVRGKKYIYKGIKELYGFDVLGRSTVLVPEKSFESFKVFLDENDVKYKEKKIWLE